MWNQFFSQMKNCPKRILKNLSERERYKSLRTEPVPGLIFHPFSFFPPEDTKVVILCKEPYWIEGLAMGLAYGVPIDCNIPLVLDNIFSELKKDVGATPKKHLESWAEQGVLLLNLSLTVKVRRPGSDIEYWKPFTDELLLKLSTEKKNIVFLLWGDFAQKKEGVIYKENDHLVLKSCDPNPLVSKKDNWPCLNHFSKTNRWLKSKGKKPIDW